MRLGGIELMPRPTFSWETLVTLAKVVHDLVPLLLKDVDVAASSCEILLANKTVDGASADSRLWDLDAGVRRLIMDGYHEGPADFRGAVAEALVEAAVGSGCMKRVWLRLVDTHKRIDVGTIDRTGHDVDVCHVSCASKVMRAVQCKANPFTLSVAKAGPQMEYTLLFTQWIETSGYTVSAYVFTLVTRDNQIAWPYLQRWLQSYYPRLEPLCIEDLLAW